MIRQRRRPREPAERACHAAHPSPSQHRNWTAVDVLTHCQYIPLMQPHQQRRKEEKAQRRESILDAAEQVFAQNGFDAATMDEVARAARVSRALVYVYFGDKRELHLAICQRALVELRGLFEAAVASQARGRDQLVAIGRSYMRFADSHPCYFQALSRYEATEAEGKADATQDAVMTAGRAVHAVTVAAIEQGMRDGSLRSDIENPMHMAMTMWGFTHGVLQIAQHKSFMLESEGLSSAAFLDQAAELAARALEPTT